jgi:molybdopterin-guanine dinucleotide biosynthesis protein A
MPTWSAIILAGGRGTRLAGVEKAGVEVGGRTLLEWSLDAVADAREVVVVGEQVPTARPVTFTREDPRYGGPAAGLLTGFDALLDRPAYVAAVAVDMPRLTMATMRRLVEAAADRDGAVLTGPDGRRQLAVVLASARLQAVRPGHEQQHDLALWRLLAPLELVEVPARGEEHRDVDTWADLRDLG